MTILEIKNLQRYRVDRGSGLTADGTTQMVVLVLKCDGERELAALISKADAVMIATLMLQAAGEAQEAMFVSRGD